jgi:hypothetical protein
MLRLENKELFERVLENLSVFKEKEEENYKEIDESIKWLSEVNLIFVDPLNKTMRPQGKLELHAIRSCLKEFEYN